MTPEEKDLFAADSAPELKLQPEHEVPPSEAVYVDAGEAELVYVGEVQIPRPTPVELIVEIDGWDYVYKLDRRARAETVDASSENPHA